MQRVNRRSKLLNDYLERGFFKVGGAVAEWPYLCLIIVVAVCLGLTIGLVQFEIVTDVFELWTPRTSPYYDEKKFYGDMWENRETSLLALACRHKDGFEDILDEKYVQEYFNFHMDLLLKSPHKTYTAKLSDGTTQDVNFSFFGDQWKEPKSLTTIAQEAENGVPVDGYASKIVPLCSPWVTSPLEAQFELSCYSLDIFHCFAEGGYMFPFENYLAKTFFTNLIPSNPYMNKSSFQGLSKVELGSILGPSCRMWAGNLIPSNYIYGGEERINESDSTSRLLSVRSYETLLYVDSPYNLMRKIYIEAGKCTSTDFYSVRCPEPTEEEMDDIAEFANDWLKDFIDFMLDYLDEYEKDETHLLKPLFFTSRTSSDLLTEAFNSNLYLLAIAYILMLAFVSCTGCRPRNLFYSRGEASFGGMIIVLLSVLASMGLGAVFLKFSPNVVQVLPFIAIGLGVDDMFVMLQSFYFNKEWTPSRMVAEALRVAGPSVTLTTLANFLAFLIASFMPLPDVNRFAQFGMIMVVIHYFVMILGFSSVLALLARRMHNGYNDFAWLGCWQPGTRTKNPIKSQKPPTNEPSVLDPLYDFFTRDDIRIVLFVLFCVFFGAGLYGVGLIHVGLPLDSIVPASYGQDYLQARGKYYFSYISSLYTDGYRSERMPIDWGNNFEVWVNETETVTTAIDTDLVYKDKTIHSFWAWDFRDYNKKNYMNYLNPNGYTATFYTESSDPTSGKTSDCETDRVTYCTNVDADYVYNSSLYKCLWSNKALLDVSCRVYLQGITPAPSVPTIAKQIQVYSPDDEEVAGVYTAPSSDITNVFYRSDGAVIYQRSDLTWAILDKNSELKYVGLGTLSGSQPAQYGWSYPSQTLAPVTVLYYDTTYYNYGVKRENPQETDDPVRSSFKASYNFKKDTTNDGGCYALEVLQQSMSASSTFELIRLSDGTEDNSIQCGTTLDSTQACIAIRDGSSSGSVKCGSYEHHGGNSRWWVGDCNTTSSDKLFTIAAGTQDLDEDDACFCKTEVSGTQNNSYVQFCGQENFGGVNIDTSKSPDQCGAVDQTLAVECNSLTSCDSLEVCYDFIATSSGSGCGGFRITLYEAEGGAGGFGPCLLRQYSSLTPCCQQAVQKNIINNNTCAQIEAWAGSNSAAVCPLKDSCDSTCTPICYGNLTAYGSTNADCRTEIVTECSDEWNNHDEDAFEACMDTVTSTNDTASPCCMKTYRSEKIRYGGCLIPRTTYYDYTASRYDYSDCSSNTTSAGCGTYDNTQTQLECMLDQIDSLSDGCCKVALTSISNTYVFTKECAGDVARYCNDGSTVGEVKNACRNTLKSSSSLSSNCQAALTSCLTDGTWPTTAAGSTASISCVLGYSGTRSRQCLTSTNTLLPTWGDVNETLCVQLTCPAETDSDGQKWLATPVGNVASWLGSDVTPITCVGTQYSYNHRYCGVTNGNVPTWSDANWYCRAIYLQWQDARTLNTTCDSSSSMIFKRARQDGESVDNATSECQNECLVGNIHCDTIVYDYQTDICYGYDWCNPINQNDENYKLYRTPNTFPEWMAAACSSSVKPSQTMNERGIPHANCFNTYLWEFLLDPQGGAKSLDKFIVNDRTLLYIPTAFRGLRLNSSKNSIAVQGIEDDMIGTQYIIDLRDWVDEHLNDKQLWVVLNGLLFDLDTQYIRVTRYFVTNLLLCIIAVMVAGLLFLIHPLAACVVLLVEVVMVIEVYGFVDWADLHMNGILTLNMLVSIGLTMEFAAHIARAFMMASARAGEKIGIPNALSGQIRMKKALREMFTPVTLTAITTFIGIAPIASASFPYFRDYYFVLYVMMILTGWVNGAIFQPVILSFLNPGTFSHDGDRKSTNRASSMPTSTDRSTQAESPSAESP